MKAIVMYDSFFGNTEKVAQAVAAALQPLADTTLVRPSDTDRSQLSGVDLLVVGSPTRGFRPTPATAAFLKSLSAHELSGVCVAAFDTRFKVDEVKPAPVRLLVKMGGYAAPRISAQLTRAGGELVAPPEGFFVEDTEGPLRPGELDRAAAWAASLVAPSGDAPR